MSRTNIKWIIIFAALIAVSAVGYLALSHSSNDKTAQIYVDGKLYQSISNMYPDKEENFTVETEYGNNTVCVYDGAVWIEKSDCKNQTCVHFGKLENSGSTIVCAPHHLVITVSDGESAVDVVH